MPRHFTKTIKYKGRKVKVTEGDLRGIQDAKRLGVGTVDVQVKSREKGRDFEDKWLEVDEIEL